MAAPTAIATKTRLQPYYPPELIEKHDIPNEREEPDVDIGLSSANPEWRPQSARYRRLCQLWTGQDQSHRLPDGWPKHLDSPLAWEGAKMGDESSYTHILTTEELKIIAQALSHVQSEPLFQILYWVELTKPGLKLSPSQVTKETFPLGHLGDKLENLSTELHEGRGFFVLRGLDPRQYSIEENAILYLGISSYVGEFRGRQNPWGRMLYHIIDAARSGTPKDKRQSIYTNVGQPFHADVCCEILALYWIGVPERGGASKIASSWKIYNELARNAPQTIHTLAASDWVHNTFNFTPRFHRRALLLLNDQARPILNFSRRVITGNSVTPRSPSAPPITEAQATALDAVHFLAEEYCLTTNPQLGDMRFINNFSILHCRDDFQDGPAGRRHVMRLWLRNKEKGWSIPKGLELAWDKIYAPLKSIKEDWDLGLSSLGEGVQPPLTTSLESSYVVPSTQSTDCG